MKNKVAVTAAVIFASVFCDAQVQRNQNVSRNVQEQNTRITNLRNLPAASNMAGLISATGPTELYGYVIFVDPVNNEKHIPAGTGGQLAGYPDVLMIYRSVTNPADSIVDFIGNLYTSFYFTYSGTYTRYKIMIKPSSGDNYPKPYYQTGSIVYNPSKWKLETFQLVWHLWDPESGNSSYDPSLFLDKIQKIKSSNQGEVMYIPLNKKAAPDNSLPDF